MLACDRKNSWPTGNNEGFRIFSTPGKIDLGVFRVGMVAVRQQRGGGQQQQANSCLV